MKKEIPFYKMVASGNDFVVVDNRRKVLADPCAFTRAVCPRHTGVGADGVLLLETSKRSDFKMRIFNPDGSEAEACGNGFRCAALFAHTKLGLSRRQHFESASGSVEAEVNGRRVRIGLPDPQEFKAREKLSLQGRNLRYSFIRVGVPHVVILVEGLSEIPVFELGKGIRLHPRFRPAGTNVNFVEVTGPRMLHVRTYERGVEQETLACGTGVVASAIVSAKLGLAPPPIQVKTEGGEILRVDFKRREGKIRDVSLEGEAKLVFEGRWPI